MKRMCSIICLLAVCLLTGCASADAQEQDPVFTTETAATTVFETHPETTIAESTKLPETETVITTTVTEIMTTSPMTEPVTEAVSAEPQLVYETFSGILIDQIHHAHGVLIGFALNNLKAGQEDGQDAYKDHYNRNNRDFSADRMHISLPVTRRRQLSFCGIRF